MAFYEELSRYYDEIFAVEPDQMSFFRECFKGRRKLLDIGCGTGNKTEFLAEAGRSLIGLDLDSGMIAQAGMNHSAPGLEYRVGDMAEVGRLFPPASFDGILCLGNTLVHLIEPGRLENLAADLARLTEKDGLLAVQILNYDYILSQKVLELPLIETVHTVFRRFYHPEGRLLRFHTELTIKGDRSDGAPEDRVFENDIPLLPLTKNELISLFSPAFTSMRFFGDFHDGPHLADSPVTIMLAEKN